MPYYLLIERFSVSKVTVTCLLLLQGLAAIRKPYVKRLVCIKNAVTRNHGNSRTAAANNGRFVAWAIYLKRIVHKLNLIV